MRQGEIGDRFFMMQSGEVCVVDEGTADGKPARVLCILYEGHHFGEFWCDRRCCGWLVGT